jgi:RNA polymerase sigma-70 factor (ECF subfamily)
LKARIASTPKYPIATIAASDTSEIPSPYAVAGTAEVVSRWQEIELLTAAIEALPERCRAVFLLRQFENLPQREIAVRLGIAEHTVESQLTKALRRCEEYFAARGALPEDT